MTRILVPTNSQAWGIVMASLLHSSIAIECVKSASRIFHLPYFPFSRKCCRSRSLDSHVSTLARAVNLRYSIRIHSWVDLPHVYNHSPCNASHSRNYRCYFCLPKTLLNFAFRIFPILDTFHPNQWSPACPL